MSAITTPPRPAPLRRRTAMWWLPLAAAAALVLTLSVRSALEQPARVERIEITNPHRWVAAVDVTDARRSQALGLGAVDPSDSRTFQDVIDQGDTWIFRFSYAAVEVEHTVPRRRLEGDRWKVTVPEEFSKRLEAAGTTPTPG
jgi:hypothetical protein